MNAGSQQFHDRSQHTCMHTQQHRRTGRDDESCHLNRKQRCPPVRHSMPMPRNEQISFEPSGFEPPTVVHYSQPQLLLNEPAKRDGEPPKAAGIIFNCVGYPQVPEERPSARDGQVPFLPPGTTHFSHDSRPRQNVAPFELPLRQFNDLQGHNSGPKTQRSSYAWPSSAGAWSQRQTTTTTMSSHPATKPARPPARAPAPNPIRALARPPEPAITPLQHQVEGQRKGKWTVRFTFIYLVNPFSNPRPTVPHLMVIRSRKRSTLFGSRGILTPALL